MSQLIDIAAWKAEQRERAARVVVAPLKSVPRFVAGVDCAYALATKRTYCVALVWDRELRTVVDRAEVSLATTIPYVPTFLSFREAPAVQLTLRSLKHQFGAILFDGQGIAHPRRCGLATHVGVDFDVPCVGVAKSRLIGEHAEPANIAGGHVPLTDKSETIGVVLRTRAKVKPLYVSVGTRIDIAGAVELVLACCTRYRLPEPTRLADIAVEAFKRRDATVG
jgi:deoxyribonuclease V